MHTALQGDTQDRATILAIDEAVESAGRGPVFYNVIVTIYEAWSRELREENESRESDDGSMDEGSADEPVSAEAAMCAGVDVGALLTGLQNVYK